MIIDANVLRGHYREPHPLVLNKAIGEVYAAAATFLARRGLLRCGRCIDDP